MTLEESLILVRQSMDSIKTEESMAMRYYHLGRIDGIEAVFGKPVRDEISDWRSRYLMATREDEHATVPG